MIRTIAVTNDYRILTDLSLDQLTHSNLLWFWVEFDQPTESEARYLDNHFHFHHLAIEDCLHFLQRPKVDYYDDVSFFVLQGINQKTLDPEEIDLFLGPNYIVSFHLAPSMEISEVWNRIANGRKDLDKGPVFILYLIMDKLVDQFFPCVYQIEDELGKIDEDDRPIRSVDDVIHQIFEIRSSLHKIRRIITPMRDLLYRMLNSRRIQGIQEQIVYFTDVYDHLLKLSEMIESNREISADLRDSYNSLNANRMNKIMKTLTVITTIFMPLTFIAGIYGMNFENMPELSWPYGYFITIGFMLTIGVGMFLWFLRKGWFK